MQYGIPYGIGRSCTKLAAKTTTLLADSVYPRLRDMILTNVLHAGQKLVDRDLAEQLGVSRTPVREALGRLAMMGLVESRSRRGYYVRLYTADEVSALYEFRKILEVNAARLAARNATSEHMRRIDEILAELESLDMKMANRAIPVELDMEIHNLIAEASGNNELARAIKNLMDRVMCFIWVDWSDPRNAQVDTMAAAHNEHVELLMCIREGDGEGAAKKLGAHIDLARGALTDLLNARDALRSAVLARSLAR